MGGRGRAYDNIFVELLWRSVKHEDVYLHSCSGVAELLIGLTKYFGFYSAERSHQSLGNQTPQHVHETSSGGGAMIVDKYRTKERSPVALRSSGTAFEEVKIEIESPKPDAKTGDSTVQLREVECNLNWYQSCPDSGVHFRRSALLVPSVRPYT
jgi:putative transposase